MFAFDTNLLVYAANEDAPQHAAARWLADCRSGAEEWATSWATLYEFLRVATHPKVFTRPLTLAGAVAFVDGLITTPNFRVLVETRRHRSVLRELAAEYPDLAGSIMHDFHTVVLMREHGVDTLHSADAHFRRFTHLRVVNPLAA